MKTKVHKIAKGDDVLTDLFNQMTGIKDADPTIIKDKYEGIYAHIDKFIKGWEIFLQSAFVQLLTTDVATAAIEDIRVFVKTGRELLKTQPRVLVEKIKTEFTGSLIDDLYEISNKYDPKELNSVYRELKNSTTFDHIIVTLKNIKILLDEDKKRTGNILSCLDVGFDLRNTFITRATSATNVLSFSNLDFKFIYEYYKKDIDKINDLILTTLHISYLSALEIYKTFIKPDIDVDKFISAFGTKINDIKKVIPDCDTAFKCIKKSLKLFKENFNNYYKEFMTTDNPNIIFELFISDVQKKNSNNKIALMQFKKIVAYIRNNMPEHLRNNNAVKHLYTISDKIFNKI